MITLEIILLVHEAENQGLTVAFEDDWLVVEGPSRLGHLAEELIAEVSAVRRLLTHCARCDVTTSTTGKPHVAAYWGERFCGPCCPEVAAELDAHEAWPTPPWGVRNSEHDNTSCRRAAMTHTG